MAEVCGTQTLDPILLWLIKAGVWHLSNGEKEPYAHSANLKTNMRSVSAAIPFSPSCLQQLVQQCPSTLITVWLLGLAPLCFLLLHAVQGLHELVVNQHQT